MTRGQAQTVSCLGGLNASAGQKRTDKGHSLPHPAAAFWLGTSSCPLAWAAWTGLNQVYEADLLGFSCGFRPGRSAHDALWVGLMAKKVNGVLDADIQRFFDTISLEWLVKFLEHRIADRRLLRLIQKWRRRLTPR